MGQVAVKPGIANGKAQIVIGRVPMEAESLDKLNVDLFD